MSDGKKADHWGILAVNIGAKSAEELEQAESTGVPDAEVPTGAAGETGAPVENAPEIAGPSFVSPPPVYTPPRQQAKQPPKPRGSQFGSGWDKLAGEFGLEVPPPPPAKPVDEPTYNPAAYAPPKFEPDSHDIPSDQPALGEQAEVVETNSEHSAAESDRPPRSRNRSRHSARSDRADSDRANTGGRSRHRRPEEPRKSSAGAELDPVVFDEDAAEFRDEFIDELGSLNEEFDAASDFEEVEGDEVLRNQGDHAEGDRSESDSDKSRPRRRRRRRGRGRGRDSVEGERPQPRDASDLVPGEDLAETSDHGSDDVQAPGNEAQRGRRGGGNRRDRGPQQRSSESRRPEHGRYSEVEPIDQDELADEYDDLGDDLLGVPEGDIEADTFDDVDHGGADDEHDDHANEFSDDEGSDDDDVESPRIGFRNIPTWHEAVGVLVSKNMESRTRNPGGNRGHGGNRGGRGGRGRGRPDKRG